MKAKAILKGNILIRKLLLGLALVFAFSNMNAQEEQTQRRNDIVADPFLIIAVPLLSASYERLLTEDSGLGINALVGLGSQTKGFSQFSPYYRMYFGKKFAQGFFLEGFLPITTTEENEKIFVPEEFGGYYRTGDPRKVTTAGIGFGVGGKWVVKKALVIEVNGGIARRFGKNLDDAWLAEGVTGKLMGGIGYRF